jgi:hypothetical protein
VEIWYVRKGKGKVGMEVRATKSLISITGPGRTATGITVTQEKKKKGYVRFWVSDGDKQGGWKLGLPKLCV